MAKRHKSPQEKKSLDYKKQRRGHWDSNKAARKAIPFSKAYRNRAVRRELSVVASTALASAATAGIEDSGEILTQNSLRVSRRASSPVAWKTRLETLAEHVAHQKVNRGKPKPRFVVPPDAPGNEQYLFLSHPRRGFRLPYSHERGDAFVKTLRVVADLRSSGGGTRFFREYVQEIRSALRTPFLITFREANPRWWKRIEGWLEHSASD